MYETVGFRVALVVWTFFIMVLPSVAENPGGFARVVDGDTIVIGNNRVRMGGIDAPETDQVCLDARGESWNCGIAARNRLAARISRDIVLCKANGYDRYGRTLAVCEAGGEDLNAWLVREGLALAYVKYSRQYVGEENGAREHQRGLWAGAFIAPWDWRHRGVKTQILGALSMPIDAQYKLLAPASSATGPANECAIKGNVNRKGERIYHIPGSRAYMSVRMNKGTGERWFCSIGEAEAAGWRPGK